MTKNTYRAAAVALSMMIIGAPIAQAQEYADTPSVSSPDQVIYNTAQSVASTVQYHADNVYNALDPIFTDGSFAQQQLDVHYTNVNNAVDSLVAQTSTYTGYNPTQSNSTVSTSDTEAMSTSTTPVDQTVHYDTQSDTSTQTQTQRHSQQEPVVASQSQPAPSTSVVSTAQSMVGAGGYDCSGFVQAAYAKQGVNLPRTTYQQKTVGTPVSTGSLQPGDMVFFYGDSHVGIYVGGGQVIHSPGAGHNVVYENMAYMPVSGAVRV